MSDEGLCRSDKRLRDLGWDAIITLRRVAVKVFLLFYYYLFFFSSLNQLLAFDKRAGDFADFTTMAN